MRHRRRHVLALASTSLLVALVVMGCGRREGSVTGDGGAGVVTAATPAPTPALLDPVAQPAETESTPADASPTAAVVATEPPAPEPTPPPTAAPAPFVAPDLTAIERLLDELDAALGADATADTDEGSAP